MARASRATRLGHAVTTLTEKCEGGNRIHPLWASAHEKAGVGRGDIRKNVALRDPRRPPCDYAAKPCPWSELMPPMNEIQNRMPYLKKFFAMGAVDISTLSQIAL